MNYASLKEELKAISPILFELQEIFKTYEFDTGIAGGAIRDAFLGVHSNDIDIYYVGTPSKVFKSVLVSEGITFTEVEKPGNYVDTSFNVTHEGLYKGKKLQFIKCKSVTGRQNLVKAFPFNIGRFILYWNHLHGSPEALEEHAYGMQNQIIMLNAEPGNEKYIEKLKAKFIPLEEAGWTIETVNFPQKQEEYFQDADAIYDALTTPGPLLSKKKKKTLVYKVLNSPDLSKPCYREKEDASIDF